KVKMVPKRTATLRMGVMMGRLIWNRVRQKPAPSMDAASGISLGMAVLPASRITVENGMSRQQCTSITEAMASLSSPNHIGGENLFTNPSHINTQVITL